MENGQLPSKIIPLEKRIKENIKNYRLENLFAVDMLRERLQNMAELLDIDILLTDRHGEAVFAAGDFTCFIPDVVNAPGKKIRAAGRTVGHIYVRYDRVPEERAAFADRMMDGETALLSELGEERYMHRETSCYAEELECSFHREREQICNGEKEDILTGTLNKTYFEGRIKVIERSAVVPIAVINVNINDWKYANDRFGEEESDRLIQIVASIIKAEAKPDYIVGRYDGDVFIILIPMPEEEEAESYCRRVQMKCDTYEDACLSPSVACGIVYKTNLEENIYDKISDAEYEMFKNKLQIKNTAGYQMRLTRTE